MRSTPLWLGVGLLAGAAVDHFGIHGSAVVERPSIEPTNAPTMRGARSLAYGVDPREVYYPGTEELGPNEMRVVACGTGMPNARPKQAAACWLVELGNGDKFLFDIGAQSMSRIAAMKIPMDYLDKVFIGHLHMDHFGDLDALWIGGVKMNRTYPLRVWGPSGATPKMGTKYAIDGLQRMLHWDAATLKGLLDTRGERIEVTEFDYKGVNQVIYDENGVKIRSIPAIHTADGAVGGHGHEVRGLDLSVGGAKPPRARIAVLGFLGPGHRISMASP